jgi:hypothetical protein
MRGGLADPGLDWPGHDRKHHILNLVVKQPASGKSEQFYLLFHSIKWRAHRCPSILAAGRPIREGRRAHHTPQHANVPWRVADMTEQDKKRREAEQHVTDELANQAKQEPGSAAEDESKEKRAQAEKELQDAR